MANVFGILTAIVLAIASFVAYKNKAAYETEISNTTDRKAELAKSRVRLKTAQDSLAATSAKLTEVNAEIVRQSDKEVAQKKVNETLTAENAAKTAKYEPNKVKLDAIREKTAKIGDLKELASKMRTMKTELEGIKESITAAEAKLANLTAQNNQAEGQINEAKGKFERYTSGQSLPTLKTKIRAIYPTWGFVTLASGNNAGVVTNSTLDVVREGSTIAKLLVTSVESGSASASIIPESLAQDVTLMVGDQVVPSTKAATTAPASKRATTPKPAAKPAAAKPEPAAAPDPFAAPTPAPDPAATPAATPDPAPAAEATPATN